MEINKRQISYENPCYIIAEIGHNHQGEEALAIELVKAAAESGVNAVKFQKRSNKNLYSDAFYQSEYSSKNSFGKTYGEHREFLEPKLEWLLKIIELTHNLKMDFIMTVFDIESLEFCEKYLTVDAYKIQSADLTYLGLIEKVIKTQKPFFISCGASTITEIEESYNFCASKTSNFCLLYAISAYPCSIEQLNLKRITQLQQTLNCPIIGYSCHYSENTAAEYARLLGVSVIEKHFTLNNSFKGPDHHFSSTPAQMKALVKKLEDIDKMSGKIFDKNEQIESYQTNARYKMGKSAVAKTTLEAGKILEENDIIYKSPAEGINPMQIRAYLGKELRSRIEMGENILPGSF